MAEPEDPAHIAAALNPTPLLWDGKGDPNQAKDFVTHKAVEFALRITREKQQSARKRPLPPNGDGGCAEHSTAEALQYLCMKQWQWQENILHM